MNNKMTSVEIRETFLKYFEKNGHTRVASSSLVPENDATLLFANAGMNQFKNSFLGLEDRGYQRATTSQKCVRAGGKHNDLENVGFTARHHTFFEMLGNFSFGDYFKKDAIHFAWELLTKDLGIAKDKLYVTVFQDDDEAADIWHKQEGVPRDRIYRFGEKDNFWRMGDTGPCGPCSEIFYDHGPDADDPENPSKMGGDGDRYVEIWNLVFMQFNEDGKGRHSLPKPSVDTGGGLERWTSALQGKPNNYDTDLFAPIIGAAAKTAKIEYVTDFKTLLKHRDVAERTSALRVIADHSRAAAFLMADGVLPSNEGRGYVLRRILRRAIRYGRKLSDDPNLLSHSVKAVILQMSAFYPELARRENVILTNIHDEVARFLTTLDQGTEILENALKGLSSKGQKVVDGELIFKLYDTYGFPVDLTNLMAREKGFSVDEAGFEKRMSVARETAKASWKGAAQTADAAHLVQFSQAVKQTAGATEFTGYTSTHSKAKIAALSDGTKTVQTLTAGQTGIVAFAQTPFYAEGGGQAGDTGTLKTSKGHALVLDTTKQSDIFLHHIQVVEGALAVNEETELQVRESARRATAANHSATHLLHAALRKTLGNHVTQAGSLVEPNRLRFDFTHNKPLSREEIETIETEVNREISESKAVQVNVMGQKEALAAGAMALFGEKYGDQVRVVKMGSYSTELCGGTHVENTSAIRLFKLVSESGVSAGVRRIEALTGDMALRFLQKNTQENLAARMAAGFHEPWSQYLGLESSTEHSASKTGGAHASGVHSAANSAINSGSSVVEWIENNKAAVRNLEREIQGLKSKSVNVDEYIAKGTSFSGGGGAGTTAKLVTAHLAMDDRKALSDISDRIKDKVGSGIIVVVGTGAASDGTAASHPIIVTVTKDLTGKFSAGKILNALAADLKGKGGGRPDFAQGAGSDLTHLAEAFNKVASVVKS